MANQYKLSREVSRGTGAQSLLDNEILKESFSVLEQAYIETWKGTSAKDHDGREKLFLAVNIIGKVREHLAKLASGGRLAASEIEALAAEEKRKKLLGIL